MNTPPPDSPQNVCPKCGRAIPEGSPRGLCPLCLISEVAKEDSPAVTTPGPELDELRRAFPTLEIVEPLGSGGMGRVYKVRQPHLDRFCALKLLPPAFAEDPAWIERFTREARALARLNHPGIVQVYDFGEASSADEAGAARKFPFLLMEFVDGVNLRQALRSGSLTAAEVLSIVPPICAALQYAHNQGVLHRDIKPENILLDADGCVKIADFGLAKLAGAPNVPGATLTATGAQLGTAAYMAPEQIERPQDVDHRADIFSLGVVFYELLTGELPLGRFPAPSEAAGTDPRLDTIVFRTLEKQRERRFQTAGEVKSEVEHVTSNQPPPMPPIGAPALAKEPTPAERKSSATIKIAAIVLSLIVLPAVLVGLMLFIPKAQAPAPWGGVTLAIIGIVPTAAFLLVLGLTWLFRRLKRAGVSTGVAAAIVALVLLIIPPAGCVALLVPPYLFARSQPPVQMVQLTRSSTELRKTPLNEDEISAHWKVSGQHPMWITVEVLGARRQLQLRSDGVGRYAAEIDLKINRSSTGETARLQLELGNGVGKAAGEFSFISPPDGWMNRIFDEVANDGLYGAGKTTLARIGSDLMTLTITSDAPPAAQNAVSFTLRDVSFYEDTGTFDLKIEYLEKIEGDAELYFKNEGIEGSTYPSSAIGRIADQSELRSRRYWRLPDGLNDALRRDLKFRIESQYLNKTIQVPAGELWEFFQIKLPDGKTAHATMGARSGKR